MDVKKLATVSCAEIEPSPSKFIYTTTCDPFGAEFCGSFGVADRIMEDIRNGIKYQIYIKSYFNIKKVIFNDPATIVYWEDGTKTVVKCSDGDTYDKEKGLALCFMKKALGNKGNFNNVLKEHTK